MGRTDAHYPRLPLLLVAGGALVLSACAHYVPRPLDARQLAQQLQLRRLDDPALAARARQFHSLGIERWPPQSWGPEPLFAAALLLSPDLAEARARLTAAIAAVTTARAVPNPTLGLAMDRYQKEQQGSAPWAWSLSLDLPISALRNRTLQSALANDAVRSARLNYAERLWRTRSTVRAALRDLLFAQRQVVLGSQRVEQQRELVESWQRRRDAGAATPAELQQATLGQLQALREAAAAGARVDAARAALAQAVGVGVDAIGAEVLEWPALLQPAPVEAAWVTAQRDRALLSRTEVERALSDYDAAEHRLQLQIRAQYPQLSAGPTYNYDHGVRKIGLAATLSLPLFNRNQGPIAEAEAQRQVAGLRLEAAQATVLNGIDAAAAALNRSIEVLARARSQQSLADRLVTQTESGVQAGAEDRVALLGARIAATVAAQDVLEATAQAQAARAALEDALQAPLEPRAGALDTLMQESGVVP